jgi:hypothetical protein
MIKIRRLIAVSVLVSMSCANPPVDPKKFDAVDGAARAVQSDLTENDGNGSSPLSMLLQHLEREVAALDGRTNGRQEAAVLRAYASATEAYKYVLRFQLLERDAVKGMVLLSGSNRPIASRYGFPMENRGGGRWVNWKAALKILSDKADADLADAQRLLSNEGEK